MEMGEQIGLDTSLMQITQRKPIRIRRPVSDHPSLLRSEREMEMGRTDSKVHSSGDNEPILSQNALSSAINSLVKVVTCSGV